jgi:D-glycero-beta-D-manno-heptose-7-phosphate kinase
MKKATLIERIKRLSDGKVMVVGDIAIDEMIYGETSRLSREAPVIILNHQKTDILLGAGGNAAHNLAALGAKQTAMAGVAGKDYYCSLLFEAMERDGVSTDAMVQDEARPTSTKSRISGSARQSVLQQIVRIDRESDAPISSKVEQGFIEKLTALAPDYDALILSDYKLGVLTPQVIETCQALAKAHNLLLAVDSHRDLAIFHGATIATPNLPEAELNLGLSLATNELVISGGRSLKSHAGLKNLLITRGSDGMSLFDDNGQVHHIPAFNKSEVFDVTGAGDTVISTLTLAMATGSSPLEAAVLGNLAASIVVKKYGTAVTSPAEMIATLEELDEALLKFESHNAAV